MLALLWAATGSCAPDAAQPSALLSHQFDVSATADALVTANAGNAVAVHEGRVLIANSETPGFFQVFDSLGRFQGRVGKSGQGPAEFGYVRDIAVARDGSIWVLDQRNRRLAHLNDLLEVVATYPVPFRPVNMAGLGLEVLANGDILLLGCWQTLDSCGAHRWAPDGLKWSYHVNGGGTNLILVADEGEDGSIWVVDGGAYRLYELTPDGALRRERSIQSEWFAKWLEEKPASGSRGSVDEAGGGVAVYSPRARIHDIEVLSDRVLVLGGTGDDRWESASLEGFLNLGLYLDTVIEVLARDDLRTTVTEVIDVPDGIAVEFIGSGLVAVAESHPVFDRLSFWKLELGYDRPAANNR